MKSIIKLEKVTKEYKLGDSIVIALKDVDIDIKRGDFVAIVGPSGSGKSTMMHIIGALDIATKGEVLIDEINLKKLDERELADLRGMKIGFVFQTFNLIPTLTALENVMLPMIFQGVSRDKREKRAKKILIEIGLEHRLNHLPNEMSGGERQRVAFARAIINDPDIILADEPTGNLDSKKSKEIVDIFIRLNKDGKTIIIVTHNLEIAKYANKIYKIEDGSIVK